GNPAKDSEAVRFPYTVSAAGEWQEISVNLKGPATILRLHLPSESVEFDWIELQAAGAQPRRWEF
ncbi:MAG: hypothetical protein RLZZ253_427, partial [Verrucomicrobiota bacterium]